MLKFYCVHYTTYLKGQKVGWTTLHTLCEESEAKKSFRKKVTWENLADVWEEFGRACGFSIWSRKRGRQISFLDTWYWEEPKEWKHADPQVEIECCWSERLMSIQEVLEWHDSEKAIQYLNERNLKIGLTN